MKRFDSKTVIVTGGGGGIGGATCRRFAVKARRSPCSISISKRQKKWLRHPGKDGGTAEAFRCDITERKSVDAAVAAAESRFAPIDILVNNAGWDIFCPFAKTEPAQWDKLIAVNLTGALHMHHAVLPGMTARKSGRIVNISSDAARVGSSGEAVYAACKGGLVAFSKTIAREHARHGITVNVVCPGPTDTALFADYKEGAGNPEKLVEAFKRSIPLGRIGQPEDLPGAILFFASDDADLCDGPGAERIRRLDDERLIGHSSPGGSKMEFEDLIYEIRNGVAWIIINRPDKMNAFRGKTCDELIKACTRQATTRTSAPSCSPAPEIGPFCTGGDQSAHDGNYDGRGTIGLPMEELHTAIRDVPKPVIARVQGYAIGGGNVLCTICDLTICSEKASFRPGRPQDGLGRSRLRHRVSGPGRRRKEGPRDVVYVPTLLRPGGSRHGAGQRLRAARPTRRRSAEVGRGIVRAQPDSDRDRQAQLQHGYRPSGRHRRHGPVRAQAAITTPRNPAKASRRCRRSASPTSASSPSATNRMQDRRSGGPAVICLNVKEASR